jgi:hypothetical protein
LRPYERSDDAGTAVESVGSDGRDGNDQSGSRWMSVDDIRDVYAGQADRMERLAGLNRLLTGRYRRSLFGTARERVLDVTAIEAAPPGGDGYTPGHE